MAVDAVDGEKLDERRELVVGQVGTEPPRKRERVADLRAGAVEAQVELAALLPEHPEVERGVVGDKQRAVADRLVANRETDRPLASLIDSEYRDQKAVKIAIRRLYDGHYELKKPEEME